MKRKIRTISAIVALTILSQTLVGATALQNTEITSSGESLTLNDKLVEDITLRSENVKTFKTKDGGYIASVYDEPVHFLHNGLWEEIDNSLSRITLSSDESESTLSTINISPSYNPNTSASSSVSKSVTYLENKANSFKVMLPENLTSHSPIRISNQGFILEFCLKDALETHAYVEKFQNIETEKTLKNTLDQDARNTFLKDNATILKNQISTVSYETALPSSDIIYQISGQKLKESLVFRETPTQSSFSFELTYTDLYPVIKEFGEVHFLKVGHEDEKPIFIIDAPYLFDSGDSISMDVDVTITTTETGCVYTLIPDSDWLNDPLRVYPVTMDPSIKATTSTDAKDIQDNGVNESDPTKNYKTVDRMYVGSNISGSKSYESRIYIRFPRIASIPTSAYIFNATMYLNHYPTMSYQSAVNNTIDVYEVGGYDWSSDTITWDSQSKYSFSNKICQRVTDKNLNDFVNKPEDFDITALVRKWYRTTASNNGLVIKPRSKDTSKTNRTCFYSSDCSVSNRDKRPRISIEYYLGSPTPGIKSNGLYFLKSVYSGLYADVTNNGGAGTALIQYNRNGGFNQLFAVQHIGADIYSFIPQHNTSLRIDVPGAGNSDGLNLQVHTANNTKAQMFRIIRNNDSWNSYRIMPLCSDTRVIDIEGPSTNKGAPLQIWTWNSDANQMKWIFQELEYGNGGSYRNVTSQEPNCMGYALQVSRKVTPNGLFWPDSHKSEDFSDKFKGALESEAVSVRRIPSSISPIESNEYRVAVRVPNGLDGIHIYHVIYQLSDGRWAGKDDTGPSEVFPQGNPSVSPNMWSNNAYSPSAGTIYFAIRRW